MESTGIAIFSTLLGLILALTDVYIEKIFLDNISNLFFRLNKI